MPKSDIKITVNISVNDEEHHHHPHHRRKLHWKTIGPVSEQKLTDGPEIPHTMLQLTDTQKCSLTVGAPVDKKGAPAPVQDGSVVWTSSDSTVATVVQDVTNPLAAVVVAGLPGTAQINVSGDADLGDGVTTIAASPLDVTVLAGAAVAFGPVSTGTPEEQQ